MKETKQEQIQQIAREVIEFNPKARRKGGNHLKRKCNAYGLTLKYIFRVKDLTYVDVGNLFNVTPQSINHLVNRSSVESFSDTLFLKKVLKKLRVNYDYFCDLVREVQTIME